MMFVVRTAGPAPTDPAVQVKVTRTTPEIVPGGIGKTDYFCVADAETMEALRAPGVDLVELRDGWYADDAGGGIAIFGHGRYWEVRDAPLSVREAVGPEGRPSDGAAAGDHVNVRGAIFGV